VDGCGCAWCSETGFDVSGFEHGVSRSSERVSSSGRMVVIQRAILLCHYGRRLQ
jgi:hypothetical protein